jgi:hypothetical protein
MINSAKVVTFVSKSVPGKSLAKEINAAGQGIPCPRFWPWEIVLPVSSAK